MKKRSLAVRILALTGLVASALTFGPSATAASQNDGGSRKDAGNTFADATKVKPRGWYEGELDATNGDADDFYKFKLPENGFVSVTVQVDVDDTDPITLLDPNGNIVDVGTRVRGLAVNASRAWTQEMDTTRLAVHRAVVAGDYRLHLHSGENVIEDYALCFMNCEQNQMAPSDMIFGGSLKTTDARVLLVPPLHGDMGNPFGPTVVDYLDATLRGINGWIDALDAFAQDFPQYNYLRQIDFHIEIFDEAAPVDPVGYDVILGYVAAGPAFRGVAGDTGTRDFVDEVLQQVGIEDQTRYSGRVIALSLFGSAPRSGQVMYDFPEISDLEIVTLHEFGHTFGLGHTTTWTKKYGPDLMNSPAPFVYGDGFPFGDGGERTKMKCLSSLNLYGMAWLYRWIPSGEWLPSEGAVDLPKQIPYRWYCPKS